MREVEQVHGSAVPEGYCYFSWSTRFSPVPSLSLGRPGANPAAARAEQKDDETRDSREQERPVDGTGRGEERSRGRMIGSFLEIAAKPVGRRSVR